MHGSRKSVVKDTRPIEKVIRVLFDVVFRERWDQSVGPWTTSLLSIRHDATPPPPRILCTDSHRQRRRWQQVVVASDFKGNVEVLFLSSIVISLQLGWSSLSLLLPSLPCIQRQRSLIVRLCRSSSRLPCFSIFHRDFLLRICNIQTKKESNNSLGYIVTMNLQRSIRVEYNIEIKVEFFFYSR